MQTNRLVPLGLACVAMVTSAGTASAEETAAEVISRLEGDGYTVTIDKLGTAPLSQCVVTDVRNPTKVAQWRPYPGPTAGDEDVLVLATVNQSISVSLDCNR